MMRDIMNSVLAMVVLAVGVNLAVSLVSILLPWKAVIILGLLGIAFFLVKIARTSSTAKY